MNVGDPIPSPAELVRAYGRPAKKRLGQNFLTDPGILDRVVRCAGIGEGDRVLEIGPGPGGLTGRLLAAGADVLCLEADAELVEHLERHLGAFERFAVVRGDGTGPDLDRALGDPPRLVVANLPYNVATPILLRLVDLPEPPARMALMFQREVADRIVSPGASRDFGPLSVAVSLRFTASVAMKLSPGAVVPRPKVSSAVVLFERLQSPLADADVRAEARRLARMAFNQRRKMLRRSLASAGPALSEILAQAAVPPDARPEQLRTDDFVRMGRVSLELGTAAPT